MIDCSIGSNRGYDELVPHHIDVVKETRFYRRWNVSVGDENPIDETTGFIVVRNRLNELHRSLSQQGFDQVGHRCSLEDETCSHQCSL